MEENMSKKKIPFNWLPGSWGLAGKTREIAQAEYELEGYELEKKLLEIKKDELENADFNRKRLEIDYKYNKISEDVYHRQLANSIVDDKQRGLALLELNHKCGSITDLEYAKRSATLRNEPWVTVINMDFSGKTSEEGSFELDWNEPFVEKLKSEGYVGLSSDIIVNQWFMTVCRNVAMEEFDGTGDFTADSASNLETFKRWSTESTVAGKRIHK